MHYLRAGYFTTKAQRTQRYGWMKCFRESLLKKLCALCAFVVNSYFLSALAFLAILAVQPFVFLREFVVHGYVAVFVKSRTR